MLNHCDEGGGTLSTVKKGISTREKKGRQTGDQNTGCPSHKQHNQHTPQARSRRRRKDHMPVAVEERTGESETTQREKNASRPPTIQWSFQMQPTKKGMIGKR